MVDNVGPADGLRTRLREAKVLDLALLDQILDGAGDLFNRHSRVRAMLIKQQALADHAAYGKRRMTSASGLRGAAVGTRAG